MDSVSIKKKRACEIGKEKWGWAGGAREGIGGENGVDLIKTHYVYI